MIQLIHRFENLTLILKYPSKILKVVHIYILNYTYMCSVYNGTYTIYIRLKVIALHMYILVGFLVGIVCARNARQEWSGYNWVCSHQSPFVSILPSLAPSPGGLICPPLHTTHYTQYTQYTVHIVTHYTQYPVLHHCKLGGISSASGGGEVKSIKERSRIPT